MANARAGFATGSTIIVFLAAIWIAAARPSDPAEAAWPAERGCAANEFSDGARVELPAPAVKHESAPAPAAPATSNAPAAKGDLAVMRSEIAPPPPESAVIRPIRADDIPAAARERLRSRLEAKRAEIGARAPLPPADPDAARRGWGRPLGEDRVISSASLATAPLETERALETRAHEQR
jgi:hypothetical protein